MTGTLPYQQAQTKQYYITNNNIDTQDKMSASNRKLVRLPVEIFEDLISYDDQQEQRLADDVVAEEGSTSASNQDRCHQAAAEKLRSKICFRLKRFRPIPINKSSRRAVGSTGGGNQNMSTTSSAVTLSIKTVGDLLQTSKRVLLHALDPILTYAELCLFLKLVHKECSPRPMSALELLHSTVDNTDTLLHSQTTESQELLNLQQPRPQQQERHENRHMDITNDAKLIRSIPTSIPTLDYALKGGVRIGNLTEVVGPAGIGKTQLAFQLCMYAASFGQGAMYIDTENKVNLQRLKEMCWQQQHDYHPSSSSQHVRNPTNFRYTDSQTNYDHQSMTWNGSQGQQQQPNSSGGSSMPYNTQFPFRRPEEVLDNLSIHTPNSTSELIEFLDSVEDRILNQHYTTTNANHNNDGGSSQNNSNSKSNRYPVRLLIVDSIAAPLKRDYGSDSAPQRAAAIFKCAQTLKRLADQLPLAVIAINQVGLINTPLNNANNNGNSNLLLRASLGTSWRHCISTSLFLNHKQQGQQQSSDSTNTSNTNDHHHNHGIINNHRQISIVKSNRAPLISVDYQIERKGLVEVLIEDVREYYHDDVENDEFYGQE